MKYLRYPLACALSAWLAVNTAMADQSVQKGAPREIAILHIRVLSGEDSLQTAGAVSKHPIVVLITDESGRPVESATVSFRLPSDGPGGTFSTGLKSEVMTTGSDGRAGVFAIQWDGAPGSVQLRVTAVKGDARAGTILSLTLAEAGPHVKTAARLSRSAGAKTSSRGKWAVLAIAIAGAAAGGLAAGLSQGGSKTTPAASAPAVQIGSPSISIGRP
jgi:hypothetical protein